MVEFFLQRDFESGPRFSSTSLGPQDGIVLHNWGTPTLTSEDILRGEDFSSLDSDICEFWTGTHSDLAGSKLIFCGSEISFRDVHKGQLTSEFQYCTVHDVSRQESNSGASKRLSPLVYGEEYYFRKMRSNKEYKFHFVATDGVCPGSPVTTGQPVSLKFAHKAKPVRTGGIKVLKLPCSDPVDRWMQSFAVGELHPLRHKASRTELGLAHCRHLAGKEIVLAYQQPLIRAMMSGSFDDFPQSSDEDLRNLSVISREWFSLSNISPQDDTLSISAAVKAECMEEHNRNRSAFKRNVADMVRKTYYLLLHEKVRKDHQFQKRELAQQSEAEVSEYLSRMRHLFTQSQRDYPTLFIKRCKLNKTYKFWGSDTLNIKYATQVIPNQ